MPTTLSGSAKSCGLMALFQRGSELVEKRSFNCTASNSIAVQAVDTPRGLDPSEGVLQWKLEENRPQNDWMRSRAAPVQLISLFDWPHLSH